MSEKKLEKIIWALIIFTIVLVLIGTIIMLVMVNMNPEAYPQFISIMLMPGLVFEFILIIAGSLYLYSKYRKGE